MQNSVWSRFHFSPFSPLFLIVYTRVKMLSSVSSPLKSLFRACQWSEGTKLQLEITARFISLPCIWRVSNSCSITCTSCADCKNRMWKFMEDERRMEMMMYDWKWYDCFFLFSSFFTWLVDSFDTDPLNILFLSRYRCRW